MGCKSLTFLSAQTRLGELASEVQGSLSPSLTTKNCSILVTKNILWRSLPTGVGESLDISRGLMWVGQDITVLLGISQSACPGVPTTSVPVLVLAQSASRE